MRDKSLEDLRRRLVEHPLWQDIEAGTLPAGRLRLFALQDWWLVREAYRLDALAVVAASNLEEQELLLAKLMPKIGGYRLLLDFGAALGLSRADFERVEPLAGCMALTNFFYWMLAYGSPVERLAAVGASEDVFVEISERVGPALVRNYNMPESAAAFFTAHRAIGQALTPLDQRLLERYSSDVDRHLLRRAIRLSHEYELMFYDTVYSHESLP